MACTRIPTVFNPAKAVATSPFQTVPAAIATPRRIHVSVAQTPPQSSDLTPRSCPFPSGRGLGCRPLPPFGVRLLDSSATCIPRCEPATPDEAAFHIRAGRQQRDLRRLFKGFQPANNGEELQPLALRKGLEIFDFQTFPAAAFQRKLPVASAACWAAASREQEVRH